MNRDKDHKAKPIEELINYFNYIIVAQDRNVYICTPLEISGYSVARLSRLVWDEEVASSNLATPTKASLFRLAFLFTKFL